MPSFNLKVLLPPWIQEFSADNVRILHTDNDRMNFVIELSRQNIIHKTGGPFGAAVFERLSGRLLAVGVNLVIHSNCSHNHAEMIALAIAQHRIERYTLYGHDIPAYELVTSTEPCTMCFGAVIWSGITRLVCGAYSFDAEHVGFDEGPKPENWIEELEKRGIEVITGVHRTEARSVLLQYIEEGGIVYNSRSIQ